MRHLLSCVLWRCELCGTWRVLERRCKPCVAKLGEAMRERLTRFMAELRKDISFDRPLSVDIPRPPPREAN